MQNRALTLTLTALTCVTAVLLCLAQSASGAVAPSLGKTASGDFFWQTEIHTQQIAVQPLQPQWEIGLATIPTASGRGGWLSPDPIESVTGKMAEMLPEGSNLYAYVGNDPVNGIDAMGLDRWVCGVGHTSVVVEDPLSSTGYHRYEFGPDNWYGALHGSGRMYKTEADRPNPWFSMRIPSTPNQDSVLIQVGDDYNKTPTSYNLVGSNCRHHSSVLKDAGMGAKNNPFTFTPFLSSPWIQPR